MKFKELTESSHKCPHCGGPMFSEMMMMEKKDACYYKVKAGAKVWPSAYASGRLVQCRKKGAANYGNKSEGKINEFAPPGGDDRGPNDEEILRRLAAQWWSGTEQQMIKAQQTLEALGWEIGPDESGNDDAGVYVYRIGDNDGRDTLAFGHGELSLDEGVAKDDNSDVADISDSDYMRIKGIVDKKYPGYELASLNIGRDGYIEIEIYNYKTHDTKHLKTKSTSENKQGVLEDWQKANKRDRTAGMSQKAVNAYRRENPGSKLKTAVTTKPSKLKRGSKASKRRKSYCSRSRGQMKMHSISCAKTPDKAICKARRRWNC